MSEIINGGDVLVYAEFPDGSGPGETELAPIAHQTECSIEHKTNFRERRTKQTKGKERFPDETDTTISVSSLVVYGDYSYFDLRKKQKLKEPLYIEYLKGDSDDEGAKFESGHFYIESLKRSDNEGDDGKVDVTFVQASEPEIIER